MPRPMIQVTVNKTRSRIDISVAVLWGCSIVFIRSEILVDVKNDVEIL